MCYNLLMEFIQNLNTYEVVIFIILGVLVTLFGFRLKKVAFFVLWFLLGYNLVLNFLPTINNLVPQIVGNELWQALLPFAGGLLLGLLGFTIEKICLSLVCFGLVMMIGTRFFGTEIPTLLISGAIGVVVGGASSFIIKPATIFATSIMGAYALTLSILTLSTFFGPTTFWPFFIGIAVIGSIFQFSTNK